MIYALRLYWEIARRSFQRQLAYRTANLAGLVTNCCFGYLRGVIFIAVYVEQARVGGYDVSGATTFNWVTQSLLMVVALWGWWEIEDTIRSGDIVSDLAKPFSYLGFWLARDYGRAVAHLAFRGLPILVVGELTFGLRWPREPVTWLAFGLSVFLAVTVSFGWRFILNLAAFWLTDARGLGNLLTFIVTVFTGILVPLTYFPDAMQPVLLALPFAGLLQTPADIFVERLRGPALLASLGRQAIWAIAFLIGAQLLLRAAVRRVVIQGG